MIAPADVSGKVPISTVQPPHRARRDLIAPLVVAFASLATIGRAEPPSDSDHALPCRPTIACTAAFVPPGTFEVETGVLFRRIDGGARQWTVPFLLKQTLTETVQVQVGGNGYGIIEGDVPAQYFDDVVVGPKVHLLDQTRSRPSLPLKDGMKPGPSWIAATIFSSVSLGMRRARLGPRSVPVPSPLWQR